MANDYSFKVDGLEPWHDPVFRHASALQRLAFYKAAKEVVLIYYDEQMAAGKDRNGKDFDPISEKTRRYRRSATGRADPEAPPLTPAYHHSRARSLVDARVEGNAVRVFWRVDSITGKRWGVIMDYHRKGGKGRPSRDGFGLAPAYKGKALQVLWAWWARFSRGLPAALPKRGVANKVSIGTRSRPGGDEGGGRVA